ncbi:teichoic acid export ATP-binding protein TagH [Sulfuriferula multivorans]|uniref:Teichoic acid export ATP-binding protein TagH n=1 Tax=Sulfuriferula multivorans TaxID=1559896 RepID=A0A401JDL8_9PROT|nr:ABC transporter ATP-binding protein [Sulfuriferula multivorans]GBL45768.1 teichoic acid export ATP-binding protein TagH [Sulfuriferula multivorans]
MSIIEVNHVTKEYKLGQIHSLKTTALNQWRRLTGQPVEERAPFKALDDVNFSIEAGEVVGIIGHNGAGKSTILKLLANISKPSSGSISVKGKVAPLIEVGAGLIGDLTGRENIYLNGAILGISKAEITRKFDEIVAFAELEEFIDTPIKRYSSGMQVRLGFSIATSVESDILIVDEVLAVGDLAFQRKCFDRMEDLIKRQGKTVLLVSHNIRQVQRLCSRVIMLDHGRINLDGTPQAVCDSFYEQSDEKIKASTVLAPTRTDTSGELELMELYFLDHDDQRTDRLSYNHDCVVHFRIRALQRLDEVTFGFGFHTTDFLYLTTHNSEEQLHISHLPPGEHEIVCKIARLPLLPGVYSLRFGVTAGQAAGGIFYGENLKHFQVVGDVPITVREGFFALDAHWLLEGREVAEIPAISPNTCHICNAVHNRSIFEEK